MSLALVTFPCFPFIPLTLQWNGPIRLSQKLTIFGRGRELISTRYTVMAESHACAGRKQHGSPYETLPVRNLSGKVLSCHLTRISPQNVSVLFNIM